MSKTKTTAMSTEDKIDTIVGIVVIAAIFAVFALVVALAGTRTAGEIAYAQDATRGTQQMFVYTNNQHLEKGDEVKWYVNNQCVETYTYDGESATFTYTHETVGTDIVRVVSGKYAQVAVVEVKKPVLTLKANDIVITYGEQLPDATFSCEGLVCGETLESLGLNLNCSTQIDASHAGVGQVTFDNADFGDIPYEVNVLDGTVTVLPRELQVTNELAKTYDQTNVLENPTIVLSGVLEGDEVSAHADRIFFESRNVGTQKIYGESVCLEGKDACNYKICDNLTGTISPKEIVLEGLTVADKYYDGTTRAEIAKMGNLCGVIDGDSVAIGSLDISFENADSGEKEIVVKDATLVGMDKDNYILTDIETATATINRR